MDDQPTYTISQVHYRLRVPKPTIRHWSAAYAEFLSERARPDNGKTRVFIYDDLIVLNTVRHLTRGEGLNSIEQIRQALLTGLRINEFLPIKTVEEREALEAVHLVPVAEVERERERANTLERETERITREAVCCGSERDQALLALDEANQQISALREVNGRQHGLLMGVTIAGVAFAGLLLIAIAAMLTYIAQ